MLWQSVSNRSSGLPFSIASASEGRVRLLDRLGSRPAVAAVPLTNTEHVEGVDAGLSGMTRSLQRRVSGLNVPIAVRPTD